MTGLVQVYTGDGKGKSTAAFGLAVRAAGHGLRVIIIQFMKEGAIETGESKALSQISGIELHRFGRSFIYSPKPTIEEVTDAVGLGIALAREILSGHNCDVLILDEIMAPIHHGAATLGQAIELIEMRPAAMELVLTGRNCPEEIIDRADLVTKMSVLKHPYEKGIAARRGIEY